MEKIDFTSAVQGDFVQATRRLRSRAWLLRLQSYFLISLILFVGYLLIYVFSNHTSSAYDQARTVLQNQTNSAREPYDYRLMEQRHFNLSSKLSEVAEGLEILRNEMRSEKYGLERDRQVSLTLIGARLTEIRTVKLEVDERLSRDRSNMNLEINKLKEERDQANRDGVDKKIIIALISDISFRIGALVLSIYLSTILFSTSKYLLRVADHLNSVADSVDLSSSCGLAIDGAIKALTPHSIDFHVDENLTLKVFKDLIPLIADRLK